MERAEPQRVGLYHLAWEVDTIADLVEIRQKLNAAGALTGTADHGVSKSLYGIDPSGVEFEIIGAVPREHWPPELYTKNLDLDKEIREFS